MIPDTVNKTPLFSVIMPVYNRENCVQAIDSILNQNFDNWELIVVDDGSTDRTSKICMDYEKKDARIHYFGKTNGGVSSARNLGIQKVKGEYILFLDSDDSLATNCLGTLNNYIIKYNSTMDFICFGKSTNSANKWVPVKNNSAEYIDKEKIRKKYLPTHINLYPQNNHFLLNYVWNKCYKADFIIKNNLYFDENRRTWEDGLFVVNCLDKATRILLIPDSLHIGYNDKTILHLSELFFETQIENYIKDEIKFKERFEREFDFKSEHYCRSNLNTLNNLFATAYKKNRKMARNIIANSLNYPIVYFWVSNIEPINSYECYMKESVYNKNYDRMIKFYDMHLLKNKIKKLLHK